MPILRYCGEVWSPFYCKNFDATKIIKNCDNVPGEKVLLKFYKYLLGVNRRTTNAAVRGELGQFPLLITTLPLSIKYWLRLCNLDPDSLVHKAYLEAFTNRYSHVNWTSYINSICNKFSLSQTWDNQGSLFINRDVKGFSNTLKDSFINCWLNLINSCNSSSSSSSNVSTQQNSKLRTYKLFKTNFNTENYLLSSNNTDMRTKFTKLRVSAHDLRIERDRYKTPRIPVELRICKHCHLNAVESEFHFVMECPLYTEARKTTFRKLANISIFDTLGDEDKFVFIMSCNNGDTEIITTVLKFISIITNLRTNNINLLDL